MKIQCACGHLIVDQTDGLKHKGHLIADVHWFNFWDAVDAAIAETDEALKEQASMPLRRQKIFRQVWECTQCGKLYVDDKNSRLISFSPDAGTYQGVLDRED